MNLPIGGTLIWYYYICPRQVWLICHQITPDQEDTNILIGRLINQETYAREKKELVLGSSKMDLFREQGGQLIVGEVKKSSRYSQSARMQLSFYLRELNRKGVKAVGELRFPREKKKESIFLDKTTERELDLVEREISAIITKENPPPASRIRYCRKCAYAEFCWS